MLSKGIDTVANGDQVITEWRSVSKGVPEGSILGPFRYITYTNDIVNVIENKIALFADDISVI